MSPRLPFLVVLALAVGGVAYTRSDGLLVGPQDGGAGRPGSAAEQQAPALVAPVSAAQPLGAPGSTWYCAGGDTVVVANPTGRRVRGRITTYGGDIAAPALPDPAVSIPGATGPAPSTGDPAGGPTDGPTGGPTGDPVGSPDDGPTGSTPEEEARERVLAMTALPDGEAEAPPAGETFVLPGRGRRVFHPGDRAPGRSLAGAVVEIEGGGGVAVEQQIDRPAGSDTAPCASVTSRDWHFAWGTTARDARELLVLFNPFLNDVTVDATFSTDSGAREPIRWQGLVVPAGRVLGVDLGQDVTRRDQVSASIRARRGALVVSRAQSFDGSGGTGGLSLAVGQPGPAARWTFAHGRVDDHTDERIVLYNPGDRVAEVDVALTGFGPGGPRPHPFGVVVRPGRYEIVDYTEEPRVAPEEPHATVVRSTNGIPVVAERVLTFHEDAASHDGHTSDTLTRAECHGIATPAAAPQVDGVVGDPGDEPAPACGVGEVSAVAGVPTGARTWVFAGAADADADAEGARGPGGTDDDDGGDDGEGDRRSSAGARLTVLNPHPRREARVSVAVDVDGARSRPAELQDAVVEAGSRVTWPLRDLPATANLVVESDQPVVVERTLVRDHRVRALAPGVPVP